MTLSEAIILGLVQGLTEFIPVSSSGHLILAREIFNLSAINGLAIDAVLQLATALAILAYFAKDLPEIIRDKTLLKAVLLGTIPAVIVGLLLEDYMATTFRSTGVVAFTLIAGAVLMIVAERLGSQDKELSAKKGVVVGCFQALALVPGVSRSGATISGGLFAGLTRERAARFSFLLAFPIIVGSGLKKLLDLGATGSLGALGMPLLAGSVVAFVSGLIAIKFLLSYLKGNSLVPFAWYRVILALLVLIIL